MRGRILSIQSHVVSGHVGNKSATFPLQLLGYDVDAINSVQFSNHTGYASFRGTKLAADELWSIFCGLEANDLLQYTHLLTGYVGSAEFLSTVVRIVRRMREINPDLIYVCDPVMGDDGKLYVPEDLVPIFRDELTPLANIITPNQFELELLTGLPTDDRASAYRAIDALHTRGIPTVIVSSFHIDEHHMEVLGSRSDAHQTFAIGFEKIAARFTGTGDLFSALVLAWSHLHESSEFPLAVSKALSTLQAVIQRTVAAAAGSTDPRSLELRLIDAKRDIEAPDTTRFPSVIQDRLG
eukprot:m.169944 g.169944  ORF g.169944 m.169944 type:complete len:296 (-) comp10375_c0_seq2:3516-4403(-)